MPPKKIKIGKSEIEVSESHIYLSPNLPTTYDYVPWNIISQIIEESNLKDLRLIDIGANVGDSLAHFRRFSDAPVTCIEPSDVFFSILQRNSTLFKNIDLVKKLVAPKEMVGKVKFQSGGQTGYTELASAEDSTWSGDYITLPDVINDSKTNYIIKTDTDGFDEQIVGALIDTLKSKSLKVPIIFFEGPSAVQIKNGDLENWFSIFAGLQNHKYNLLFLTNTGLPYIYAGQNKDSARAAINALKVGYDGNRALCHYYDIIAVHDSVTSDICTLTKKWDEKLFRRT